MHHNVIRQLHGQKNQLPVIVNITAGAAASPSGGLIDPLEEVNLAHNGEFREKRLELEARLREWEEKTGDFESSRIVREEKV